MRKKDAVNIENYNRPPVGQTGSPNGCETSADVGGKTAAAVGKPALAGGGLLSVRTATRDPAAEAVRRTEPAGPSDDLAPDALDDLIKSALDFSPPPMPNFGIISRDSS